MVNFSGVYNMMPRGILFMKNPKICNLKSVT